jgi:hypothetical protein
VKARIGAIVMTIACGAYLAISSDRVIRFFDTGNLVGIILAVSVIAVVIISAGLIFREIQFGLSMSKMAAVLDVEAGLIADDLPKTVDGRVLRDAADERFEQLKEAVESQPDIWQNWYRLAIGYDDSRDRKRARSAMRHAEKLFKQQKS